MREMRVVVMPRARVGDDGMTTTCQTDFSVSGIAMFLIVVMDATLALLDVARRQHSLLRRPDVTRSGVTRGQWNRLVDRGEWVHVCADVWRHALTPATWQLEARAGLLYLGHDAGLFAQTSAAWWRLDVPPPRSVEFVVPRGRRHLANDLVIHTTSHWDTADLLRHDGARLPSVTRTILDMAGAGCPAR